MNELTRAVIFERPYWPELFYFHGEFEEILCEIRQTNPPFLSLNPLFRNPASAPGYNSDVFKVKAQGREICIDRIQICVRVIIVLVAGINPVTAEW